MLEKIYHSKSIINELRQGILGQYVDNFADYFQEIGYSKKTYAKRFAVISSLSQWLTKKKAVSLI